MHSGTLFRSVPSGTIVRVAVIFRQSFPLVATVSQNNTNETSRRMKDENYAHTHLTVKTEWKQISGRMYEKEDRNVVQKVTKKTEFPHIGRRAARL